jgi:hypothetical protein
MSNGNSVFEVLGYIKLLLTDTAHNHALILNLQAVFNG